MALGKRIRDHRLHLGWTLEKLSQKSGVDIGTISALEKRDSKKSEFAVAIARGLGLSLEQLETGEIPTNTAARPSEPLTLPDLLEMVHDKMGELPEADREAMAGLVSGYINAKSENTREAMMAGIKRLCQVEHHNGGAPLAQKSKAA